MAFLYGFKNSSKCGQIWTYMDKYMDKYGQIYSLYMYLHVIAYIVYLLGITFQENPVSYRAFTEKNFQTKFDI